MANKIFVGNLPFSASADDLETLFSGYGSIQGATFFKHEFRADTIYIFLSSGVNLRKDRRTNQARGFAFVTFVEESAARQAISRMQGHSFQGRALTVSTADARGTAAAAEGAEDRKEEDAEWKTAPPSRKSSKGGKASGGAKKKKNPARSWDEWAAPTLKTSQRAVPPSVPMVSPEASSE